MSTSVIPSGDNHRVFPSTLRTGRARDKRQKTPRGRWCEVGPSEPACFWWDFSPPCLTDE
jgi:hypothetical protein